MSNSAIELERAANGLKLLGDKTRLTMIAMLKQRECCVCEFQEVFDMSQPSISQHLRKLKDAGIVIEERKGQWVYYSLNSNSDLLGLVEDILSHVPEQTEKINQIETSCGC
ncbi:winged helix-turn-helix transcriptional regulator [Bacillus sp. BRMEA1]|uniref:ArsR/SmtB family transcription factor n=1 Tax=Neobacillus endophyticus TaxID=2738405 RepID=UPI001563396A|nr:metalloregulator ArsR/SmtB family transcription factor [Neobacillus endophyticus]NRD77034.1 winged helix-turn-helix transcriptional regulator [Neobacillus endophyticus]